MTIIDQRILIPTGPETIWEYLGNISKNPEWQVDCKNISFLTSRREGPGVRWRYTSDSGRDYVLETTAWYDKLGYEYTFIDGANYRESKGRLRLQEIPEGTIVQWTFSYEVPGVIGSLRNSMGIRRSLEAVMVESLRNLWRKVNENRERGEVHEAKSLMREAPDYEQRQRYRSRHGSAVSHAQDSHERFKPASQQPIREPEPPTQVVIPEPPVSDEDTRPNSATVIPQQPVEEGRTALAPEPDFLEQLPTEEQTTDKITTVLPIEDNLIPDIPSELASNREKEAVVEDKFDTPPVPPSMPEAVKQPPVVPIEDDSDRFRPPPIPILDHPVEEQPPAPIPEELQEQPDIPAPPTVPAMNIQSEAGTQDEPEHSTQESTKLETSEMSIWEIFGVPRPSETQEIAAVKIEEALREANNHPAPLSPQQSIVPPPEPAAADAEVSESVHAPRQAHPLPGSLGVLSSGLRLRLRHRIVRLRRYR